MLAALEQKLLTLSRIALMILGIIFLVLAIWWLAFSIPSIGTKFDGEHKASLVGLDQNVMGASEFKESVWSASQYEMDSAAFDRQDLLQMSKADKDLAASYEQIILSLRAFLDRDPAKRAQIEEQAKSGYSLLLAPAEWEAIDKATEQYCPAVEAISVDADTMSHADQIERAELALAAAEASNDLAAQATAAAELRSLHNQSDYQNQDWADGSCNYTTIRSALVQHVSNLMYNIKVDERAQVHKAYIQGLEQSIKPLLANESTANRLSEVPAARLVETVLQSYSDWFSPKVYSRDSSTEARLLSDASPLQVFKNPYFVGIIGFFFMFSYLMLMLSLSRIERNLRRPD